MKFSRRPLFFGLVALVALIVVPATPSEFRGVNYFAAALAVFWMVAFGVEEFVAQRRRDREER
jgi:hypothetical protein